MDSRKIFFQETLSVAVGTALCAAGMVGVFALLGYYDASVILGAIAGSLLSVGNFLVMALCTGLAADKAEAQDVKGGQTLLQLSYIGRLTGLFVIWFLCCRTGAFNLVALVLPVLFTQPVLMVADFLRKSVEEEL